MIKTSSKIIFSRPHIDTEFSFTFDFGDEVYN